MLTTRVQPLDKDIELLISQDLSPEAQSATLAAVARQSLDEAQQINQAALGQVPPHITYVDGVAGASEASVRPDGRIVYEFELALDVLEWIGEQLVLHSPVKTGAYERNHRLFADGVEIADFRTEAKLASEYVFVNLAPYSRKIEGIAGRPPQSPQAADGVYEVVAALAQRRFGNLAAIKFSYRSVNGGAIKDWAQTDSAINSSGSRYALSHTKKMRRRLGADVRAARRQEWLTRQPAILVEFR